MTGVTERALLQPHPPPLLPALASPMPTLVGAGARGTQLSAPGPQRHRDTRCWERRPPSVSSCLCSCSRSAPSSSSCAAQRHRKGCPFFRILCALHRGEGWTPGILREEENGEDLRVPATDSQESGDQDRSKVQRCRRGREKLGRKITQTAECWEAGNRKSELETKRECKEKHISMAERKSK